MTTVEPNRLKAANCCAEVFATPFLQVLCEPSRASILRALVLKGRSDITTLAADLPLDRSVISRHLQTMEGAGVVRSAREGRHVMYEVNGPLLLDELEKLVDGLRQIRPVCCP